MTQRKLRMGLVGGGPGSFIAPVHIRAATMDGRIGFVAGAFSRDPEKSKEAGRNYHLEDERIYGSHQEMIDAERKLPEDERIDFVTISTPNDSHFPIARDVLAAGFHVLCEKPLTFNLEEALELEKLLEKSGRVFGLMHNYTGYPMVKLARDMVRQGDLGVIRKIIVRYPQGWLSTPLEESGNKQASWRTDPGRSGAAGCVADIGIHAQNLVEYISGLKISELCADVTTFVSGRLLDDDVSVLLRFDNGARGILYASQIAAGEENNLAVWIYGSRRSIEWYQENPNQLFLREQNKPTRIWKPGNEYVAEKSAAAARATRIPFGHPEAFIEAFANIYLNFADTILSRLSNREPDALFLDFPGMEEGIRGMLFIRAVLQNSKGESRWTSL